jgi:hypothetical protein
VATAMLQPEGPALTDSDVYAVYAAVLSHSLRTPATIPPRSLIVRQETSVAPLLPGCPPSATAKGVDWEWRPVIASYLQENARVRTLLANRKLGRPYQLLSSEEMRLYPEMSQGGYDWRRFLARFSGGYVELSAVGFDKSRMRAMVYFAQCPGPMGGRGEHFFLEKRQGAWAVARVDFGVCGWIA